MVIDTAARTVTRNGEAVTLTAREYALVEFLALHRGKVVTRTMLYEHLFDENDNTLSNLLDVHVSNIRKKLGHDFITTRRGHGYSDRHDLQLHPLAAPGLARADPGRGARRVRVHRLPRRPRQPVAAD